MRFVLVIALCVVASMHASCSAPPTAASSPASSTTLRIDGDVPAQQLSIESLQSLGAVDVEWKHKNQPRVYQAVPLENLLRSVGVDAGSMGAGVAPSEKRAGWKYAVIATASDGFQATFSVAELFHGMGRTEAYLALSENHRPIDAAEGPLRLIVISDGEGSRSVRNLRRITILDLRRLVRD